MMRRWLIGTSAITGLLLCGAVYPGSANAQIAATVVSACGTPPSTYTPGQPKPVTQDTTGTLCASSGGGGGGGGVAGFTAVSGGSLAVTAGTNKPAAEDLFSHQGVLVFDNLGNYLDLSGGTAGTPGGAVSSVQGVSGMVPVDTNIKQIAGAVPSLTNPIWVANAEAADVTGTFTNATQTTSVTNSAADGYAGGLISINGTYGTATGVFEESDDGGTTYYSVICARSDGTASETGYTSLTNTNRQWACPVAGNDTVRVRSTAVASGTVNVRVGISAPTPESFGGANTGTTATASSAPTAVAAGTGKPLNIDLFSGLFITEEQAGTPALWATLNPGTNIPNSNTTNLPVTASTVRTYSAAVNGYISVADGKTAPSDGGNTEAVAVMPSSAATMAVVPVVSTALESCHVLKNAPGNLFNVSVTIQATSGVLQVFNLTAAPSAGAVTPIWSQVVISNGTFGSGAWAWPANAPLRGSTGLVACFSSATTPFTYTSSATAMISAGVL